MRRLGDDKMDRSCMMVDKRDGRVVSPFQRKFVLDMSENSTASLNAVTESDQTMAPNTGYFFNLFAMQTLQHFKLMIVVSMDAS